MSLFVADYDSRAPRAKGGGHEQEGEDIVVLETTLDQAMAMVAEALELAFCPVGILGQGLIDALLPGGGDFAAVGVVAIGRLGSIRNPAEAGRRDY